MLMRVATLRRAAVVALVLSLISVVDAGASTFKTVVEPDAGMAQIDSAFASAKHSIELEMYEFNDPTIANILTQREKAGVKVQVILDEKYSGYNYNLATFDALKSAGVAVSWAPSGSIYHAKFAVIDGSLLLIGSGNFSAEYYATTRDFWLFDTQRADVQAATNVFAADERGNTSFTSPGTDLLWSPGSQSALIALITSAKKTLQIENEEMSNTAIEGAIINAAHRGVAVTVVMTYSSEWSAAFSTLKAAGVKVFVDHGESPVYIHAKAICVDAGTTHPETFVGSENFSISSLNYNRELGIITGDPGVATVVSGVIRTDAQGASAW